MVSLLLVKTLLKCLFKQEKLGLYIYMWYSQMDVFPYGRIYWLTCIYINSVSNMFAASILLHLPPYMPYTSYHVANRHSCKRNIKAAFLLVRVSHDLTVFLRYINILSVAWHSVRSFRKICFNLILLCCIVFYFISFIYLFCILMGRGCFPSI